MVTVAVVEVLHRLPGPSNLSILALDIPLACDPAEHSGGPHHVMPHPRSPCHLRSQPLGYTARCRGAATGESLSHRDSRREFARSKRAARQRSLATELA